MLKELTIYKSRHYCINDHESTKNCWMFCQCEIEDENKKRVVEREVVRCVSEGEGALSGVKVRWGGFEADCRREEWSSSKWFRERMAED